MAQAASVLFSVKTNSGSLIVTSSNSTLPILGINGIKTLVNNSTVLINYTKITSYGILERIDYFGKDVNSYFSDQFAIKGLYTSDVRNAEPFSGKIVYVDIVPILNTLNKPLMFTLYINDVSTKLNLVINPRQTQISVNIIQYPFNALDKVSWLVHSNDTSNDAFSGNVRVLINYSD